MPLKCPQCKNQIPDGNENCPYCGYKLNFAVKQINKTWETEGRNILKFFFIAGFAIVLVTMAFVFYLTSKQVGTDTVVINNSVDIKCIRSADCQVPGEWALQSHCPYQAFCVDYQCVVACPMREDQLSSDWVVACDFDDDCDCGMWDREGKYECKCLDNQCVSVVDDVR